MYKSRETAVIQIKITYALVFTIVCAVILYLYFLNLSVLHVIMRKEATRESNALRNEIALLETDYITAQHTIAGRMGTMEDFTIESEKIFVSRGQSSLVLRDN